MKLSELSEKEILDIEVVKKLHASVKKFEAELAQNRRPAGMAEDPKPLSKKWIPNRKALL